MNKSTIEEEVVMIKTLFLSDVIKDSWLIKKFGWSRYLKEYLTKRFILSKTSFWGFFVCLFAFFFVSPLRKGQAFLHAHTLENFLCIPQDSFYRILWYTEPCGIQNLSTSCVYHKILSTESWLISSFSVFTDQWIQNDLSEAPKFLILLGFFMFSTNFTLVLPISFCILFAFLKTNLQGGLSAGHWNHFSEKYILFPCTFLGFY